MVYEDKVWQGELFKSGLTNEVLGIDLNTNEQLEYFNEFKTYYKDIPWTDNKLDKLRYHYVNGWYCHSDGICLYSMMRKIKPANIIEIGSGYSSSVMMDTNDLFFNGNINMTFIEPDMTRLFSILSAEDKEKYNFKNKSLQDIESSYFNQLNENDILFIDSSHTFAINSDVNFIFRDILPSLNKGVYIHFHDIFYPFVYTKEWVKELKVGYNEIYFLRNFLQFNDTFKIVFFNTYLEHFYKEEFEKYMPLCMKNTGGSIWLQKIK